MATIPVPYTKLHLVTFTGLELRGQAPTVALAQAEEPQIATVVITGTAPTVVTTTTVLPGGDELSLNSDTVAVDLAQAESPQVATLVLNGIAPSALITEGLNVSPGVGAAAFGSDLLQIVVGGVPQPAAAALSITGISPDVEVANSGTAITNPDASLYPSRYEQCDYTGFRVLPGELVETGYGKYVRPKSFESKHPQDFVRSVKERRKEGPQRPEQDEEFVDTITAEDL